MHSKDDWDRESPFRVEFKIRALVMTLKDESRNASLEMLVLRAERFFEGYNCGVFINCLGRNLENANESIRPWSLSPLQASK